MIVHLISPELLTLEQVNVILKHRHQLALSEESKNNIRVCREYLDNKLRDSDDTFYGINTGFGSLCDVKISDEALETLQNNLVMSHACGIGDLVPPDIIRLMLLLKIQSLSYGHSAVHPALVERLIDFYNHDILPVIFQQGSLGASGDLAPLAHLSLPLIGKGEVWYQGERQPTAKVLQQMGWEPLRLHAKEGLAILNGTQFCNAYGTWCLMQAERLMELAEQIGALSLDAFHCQTAPFDERLHQVRPHPGQVATARRIRELRSGSDIAELPKESVQDPYAFRCIPQVHGASRQAIAHIKEVFLTEINAVTDNPNLFPEDDAILSGGNFHAQPLALALDYLAIALSELGSISERRLYQLISGKRGLPPFLTNNAGLQSGLMIAQYTAASIASQNKQLCTPASVDSIVSCNGQEDHVSMGANAATKAYRVVENTERLLAIELLAAAQALELRRPQRSSPAVEKLFSAFRERVPFLGEDRVLSVDMENSVAFCRAFEPGEDI